MLCLMCVSSLRLIAPWHIHSDSCRLRISQIHLCCPVTPWAQSWLRIDVPCVKDFLSLTAPGRRTVVAQLSRQSDKLPPGRGVSRSRGWSGGLCTNEELWYLYVCPKWKAFFFLITIDVYIRIFTDLFIIMFYM